MRALFTVFRKEFLENLRDRRTLVSALLFGPLFGPILFGAMVSRMLESERDRVRRAALDHRLRRRTRAQSDALSRIARRAARMPRPCPRRGARERVRSGAAPVVLIVPEEFAARFKAAVPAPVFVVADSSDSQTRKSAERLRTLLAGYGSGIAQLRVQMRGVDPLLAVPVAVNDIDVTTPAGSRRGGARDS